MWDKKTEIHFEVHVTIFNVRANLKDDLIER